MQRLNISTKIAKAGKRFKGEEIARKRREFVLQYSDRFFVSKKRVSNLLKEMSFKEVKDFFQKGGR
jgi:hypothetical protein